MNILPKKRWHVRTRENIARVRKDELEAREEAEEKRKRVLQAEQEARTTLLRDRARAKYGVPEQHLQIDEPPSNLQSHSDKHVNFFEELEEGKVVTTRTNAETELEEKEKKEKYEKQIGYLTYLGQDTVETTGNIPWYDKVPQHQFNDASQEEKNIKSKLLNDPLTTIKKYIPSETKSIKSSSETPSSSIKRSLLDYQSIHRRERKKKQKKKAKKRRKRSSRSSSVSESSTNSESDNEEVKIQSRKSLELLRAERLKREKEERERTERLLARLQGKEVKEEKKEAPVVLQKYNSQYNPELAKQNFATYSKN
ncbi:Leukocyte receptor cluster member 1 [Gryllus bimaculatus]|nr:Leukocyte receptor cluster member 1 [Gryllus bimaculatus]